MRNINNVLWSTQKKNEILFGSKTKDEGFEALTSVAQLVGHCLAN